MATDFMAKFAYMRSFGRVAFENGLQYRHSDSKIFNGHILATYYANMMKIDPVTPPNISLTTGPIFPNVSALVDASMGITNLHKLRGSPRGVAMVTD